MSRLTARPVFRKAPALTLLGLLALGGVSLASETAASYPPVAINAWTGIGIFYLHQSDPVAGSGTGSLAARLGGDVGFRFSRQFSLLAVADYQAFLPDEDEKPGLLFLAPGLRWQPESAFQFTFAAGYAHSTWSGNGVGFRAIAFWPVLGGFGPYSQISFNVFAPHGIATQLLDLTLGISYSF